MVVKCLTKLLLVKCDSQLTVDVIPYNNRNDGGPAAGLLSLVEVPEKAIKTLVGCVKKKSMLYEIFRFFRFLIKKLLL
jgi:hypothetical protein